jgi:pimeloyl-ACP methyl ester carboxylesterase
MSQGMLCESGICSAAPVTPVSLEATLRRFECEARRGVCDTGRYRCSYYVWGTGPPLLFVHGVSDTARSFVLPIAHLAARFRCIAYDLPTGQNDGARLSRYTHADLVADLFALLDHLDVRQTYVYGSSFGSTIALAAMGERPARLPRAVLQGGFARRPLAPAELLLSSLGRYWPWQLSQMPFRQTLLIKADAGPFRTGPPAVWQFYLANSGSTPMAAVAQRARLVHRLDLRPLLPRIRQPVLMICGDCDPTVNRACEDVLLAGLPNVGRIELSGCGHFPYFTHPELLAQVVRQFLSPPAHLADGSASVSFREIPTP